MVKTRLYNAEDVGLIPGQGAKIPYASWAKNTKTENRSNVMTNSIKTKKKKALKNKYTNI